MELDEIAKRKLNFEHLSELEGRPSEAGDPYLNMNRDELLEQLNFYRKLVEEQGDIIESLRNSIDEMHKDHKESQSYIKTLLKQIADLTEKLDKALATIGNLEQKLSDYDSRNDLNNQHRFGSRSQKGITPKKSSGAADRTEQKDSFSVPECTPLHRELTQLFAYLKDGLYSIDNNIAERSIRSMTVERKRSSYAGLLPTGRKNSLMFGSHKGAEMSAIFHTFIETCKINGISTIEYFKKLLSELLTGNNNYASLLPQTIGIKR